MDPKHFYKRYSFWLLILAIVALAGLFLVVWQLSDKLYPDAQPAGSVTSAPEASSQITLPTLPPPEENPYGPTDFALDENGYMTCLNGQSTLGIDVSVYQGDIDWQQVAEAGMEFAIIKCAGRGYGEAGNLYEDSHWRQNYEGARAAGLKVGVYFFSQAITPQEAVEEAEYILSLVEGLELEMPIVYDWEYIDPATADGIPRTVAMSKRNLTDCTKAFCDRILEAGYTPMIYFNADQSHKKMHLDELTDYPFWLASYTTELDYPYKVDMWQYTRFGTVPGITGNVDINLYLHYD